MAKQAKSASVAVALNINGHRLQPDKKGYYFVTAAMVGKADLSVLPAGTRLLFMEPILQHSNRGMVSILWADILHQTTVVCIKSYDR
jgi:hypothetical protein